MNKTSKITTATTALRDDEPASEAVVNAVADEEGISPTDVRPALYAAVDPDALDELATSMARWPDESADRIVFSYAGYEVTVCGDGELSLADADSGNEPSL